MEYRRLGNTGLIVSTIALGTMQFGQKMNMGNLDQAATNEQVRFALDRGINFIDTADVYSLGESETLLGNALKGIREEVVLATKVYNNMSAEDWPNGRGLSALHIKQAVEGSLKRLQTDYIDLYQIHWPRRVVPLAETLGALEKLREQGKVRAIGVCNFGVSLLRDERLIGRQKVQAACKCACRGGERGLLAGHL